MKQATLLTDIADFMDRFQMSESTFGRRAVNDWRLVRDIRAGRRVWPETETKVREFMASHERTAA